MLEVVVYIVLGIAMGYYLGNKTTRDKVNGWLDGMAKKAREQQKSSRKKRKGTAKRKVVVRNEDEDGG